MTWDCYPYSGHLHLPRLDEHTRDGTGFYLCKLSALIFQRVVISENYVLEQEFSCHALLNTNQLDGDGYYLSTMAMVSDLRPGYLV